MSVLPDKLIFLLICTSFYLNTASGLFIPVPVIVAIIVSAAGSLTERAILQAGLVLAFSAASVFFPQLLFFLPLICMDIFLSSYPWYAIAVAFPVFYHYGELEQTMPFQLILLTLLAWLFASRAQTVRRWRDKAMRIRDDAQETSLSLRNKQRDLLEKQDNEISMARLKERNRISREIHDNLGHQLSRAIIQLGALKTICRDKQAGEQIESVTATLTEGMNSIRSSIHDIYEQSLPFEQEIQRVVARFDFCPVELDYKINHDPAQEIRNAVLAVIREALTNIMRHSRASEVRITLHEHPVFYQLIIHDNGRGFSETNTSLHNGIGLAGMRERITNLGGTINVTGERGVRIFINLPKP